MKRVITFITVMMIYGMAMVLFSGEAAAATPVLCDFSSDNTCIVKFAEPARRLKLEIKNGESSATEIYVGEIKCDPGSIEVAEYEEVKGLVSCSEPVSQIPFVMLEPANVTIAHQCKLRVKK